LIPPFSIFPLGDSAITLDLGNRIDEQLNRKALSIRQWLGSLHVPGILDIIVAYSTVSVFYDPVILRDSICGSGERVYQYMHRMLEEAVVQDCKGDAAGLNLQEGIMVNTTIIKVPVCYGAEFGPDLEMVARQKLISSRELISIHSATVYIVYMIGFLPGFSYLGSIDHRLEIPRKDSPVPVAAGGVGIAGNQTGIYPLNCPGGWQIIGRTPLKLFDAGAEIPVLFAIGDHVQFYPVTEREFNQWGKT
jgi:inhibitor of KinA